MLRLSHLLLLLGCWLLLGGCWSRIEVNDLAIVVAMAIDTGEEQPVRLTLYIARAGKGGGQGGDQGRAEVQASPVWVVAREGENVSDALRAIAQASSRRVTLHHLRVVLIGEDLARRGLDEVLDFLVRTPETRLTTRIMTVRGVHGWEVLETDPLLEGLMSEQLAEILPARGGPLQRVKEVVVAHISQTHSPWMEEVSLIERSVRRAGTPEREVQYSGAALYRLGKLRTRLDPKEARALNWLVGSPMHAVISTPCPDEPDKTFSVEILSSHVAIKPYLQGDQIHFRVAIRGQTDMTRKPCLSATITPATTALYEQALNQDLADRLAEVIAKFQESEVDPAGFGKRVEIGLPQYWKRVEGRWWSIWPESRVTMDVNLKITYAGVLIEPPRYVPGAED